VHIYKATKSRFSYQIRDLVDQGLLESYHTALTHEEPFKLGLLVVKSMRDVESREAALYQRKLFGIMDRRWAEVMKAFELVGRSNRARRARKASQLFTRYAELTRIEGVALDANGNADGEEYDFGVEVRCMTSLLGNFMTSLLGHPRLNWSRKGLTLMSCALQEALSSLKRR
jgi:hypothetical protein